MSNLINTHCENLSKKLDRIALVMHELLDRSTIHHFDNNHYDGFVVIGHPSYFWERPSPEEQAIQIKLIREYPLWFETFNVLTAHLSTSARAEVEEVHQFIMKWINKDENDYSIPSSISQAKAIFDRQVLKYRQVLKILTYSGKRELILIPDTNSLISFPDPITYKQTVSTDTFTFLLLPTVLSELDELKVRSPNLDFKEKVKSAIKRIKGFRTQGSLLDGVKVHNSITVKAIAVEPNSANSLSWLRDDNNDDRIIMSAIEVLRNYPSSLLVIFTSDVNLQNKCELANIAYAEISDKS